MIEPNQNPPSNDEQPALDADIQPSWKPLYWTLGILTVLIGLGELVLEFGLEALEFVFEVLEKIYLFTIEAPEELLEDRIEEWLARHYPHQAARYSELITAIGLTPVKIVLGLLLLRWLWNHTHTTLLPRFFRFVRGNCIAVRLAWDILAWPYKALIILGVLGGLAILI